MKTTKKMLTMLAAAFLAATMLAPTALACERCEAAGNAVSLPYVEDVNPDGNGYAARIEACGKPAKFKVICKGKKVKAVRDGRNAWVVKMKRGKTYRISVKAKHGKWKSIAYRIG